MYFPLTIDSFPTVAGSSSVTDISHAGLHNSLSSSITALETKVGINGSSDTSSLDYKVTHSMSGGGAASGSLSITYSIAGSALNLTTEGTIDWLLMNGNISPPKLLSGDNYHSKAKCGGLIASNMDWVFAGNACTVFTGTYPNPAVNADAADNVSQYVVTNQYGFQGIDSSVSGATGFGFKFSVPACTTVQVLRIYAATYNCNIVCEAILTDNSVAPVSTYFTGGVNYFEIIFKSAAGGNLNVLCYAANNLGGIPNISYSAITLGYS